MARTLSSTLQAVVATNAAATALLLDLTVAGTPHYIATRGLTFGGNAYVPELSAGSGNIRSLRSLQIDTAVVEWQNVDLTVSELIKSQLIQGSTAVLKRLYLPANEALTIFDGLVTDAQIEDRAASPVATLRLATKLDPTAVRLPARAYSQLCPWKFKSPECGHVGPLQVCNKTFADCTTRAQTHRYGGFIQITRAVEESVPPPPPVPENDPFEEFLGFHDPEFGL